MRKMTEIGTSIIAKPKVRGEALSDLPVLNHPNLSDTVYATLCDALIKGHFHPGDRLKIRDLAERLGTSVTPVRDAVLRLAHDDAVVFQTARNIQIPYLTKPRYLEIRNIRVRLESLAAEAAANTATQAEVKELERILSLNEKALKSNDSLSGAELNQAFHFQLAKIANLPTLHGILRRLWLQMGPLIAEVYLSGGRAMIDHHYDIVDAIKKGDSEGASKAIAEDITSGGKVLLPHVKQVE